LLLVSAVASAFASAVVVAERPALAQQVAIGQPGSYRSSRDFALGLSLGPYQPNIDNEFTSLPPEQRPHQLFFGDKTRLMFRTELEYQFFQRFGTLAIGAGLGYFRESAPSFIEPAAGQPPGMRAGDVTALMLLPFSTSLVYRFDLPAHRSWWPLVPYAKVGLDYVVWQISEGDGRVSKSESPRGEGSGATTGWHVVGGVSLLLDIFDPGSSQKLDAEIGVNHTYFFVEYAYRDVSGLTGSSALQVGDATWAAGLMFEF
jgi:hypothetical protein